MKFLVDEMWIEFNDGAMSGDERLISIVQNAVELKEGCGCNWWGDIEASLDTPWQAYLTICGAIRNALLIEPDVQGVPRNPEGYVSEGVMAVDATAAYRRLTELSKDKGSSI